jgi:hypothetical protein
MSDLICGLYRYDPTANFLQQAFTGQSLRLTHETAEGGLWFEYADDETTLIFVIETAIQSGRSVAALNFDRPESQAIVLSYGLWRRVMFFLIDALPGWFVLRENSAHRFWHLDFIGAWINAVWTKTALTQSVVLNPGTRNLAAAARYTHHALIPLDRIALPWQYHDHPHPPPEFHIREALGPGEVRILSWRAIRDQLAAVPYFSRVDEKMILYHRYVDAGLHRGEDYNPVPYYGFLDEKCAFTFGANQNGVNGFLEPALVNARSQFEECFVEKHKIGDRWWVSLMPAVREELLFALIDIVGLWEPGQHRPQILERNAPEMDAWFAKAPQGFPRGLRFGSYLGEWSGLPMTERNLGVTSVSLPIPRSGIPRHGFPIALRNLSR